MEIRNHGKLLRWEKEDAIAVVDNQNNESCYIHFDNGHVVGGYGWKIDFRGSELIWDYKRDGPNAFFERYGDIINSLHEKVNPDIKLIKMLRYLSGNSREEHALPTERQCRQFKL